MKLIVWTYWFASITTSGLANLPTLTEINREISQNSGHRTRQNIDFKRDQNYSAKNNYSTLNRNESSGTARVFRTYGKGKAQVKQGQMVDVPNEVGRKSNKSSVSAKVLGKNENEIKAVRYQRGCKECPTNQTVIASKGNIFAVLPEPCQLNPRMWMHHSGPRPGTKIPEGVHLIRGYLGPHKKFCQYHYQVSVRRCEPLKANEGIIINCSAENSWGSICNISCGSEKETIGPTDLECKENLTWSNSVPECKGKNDCLIPKVKTNSKISCQMPNMTQIEGDFIQNGSTCKFQQNGKDVFINCKDGKWRITRKSKNLLTKKFKQNSKNKTTESHACNPNPCQNGGTCLKPESNKGRPICKCRSETRGIYCEMRECYYNICENDGLCFFQDEERTCYCPSDYSGNTCQHYTPQ